MCYFTEYNSSEIPTRSLSTRELNTSKLLFFPCAASWRKKSVYTISINMTILGTMQEPYVDRESDKRIRYHRPTLVHEQVQPMTEKSLFWHSVECGRPHSGY